MHIALDLDGTLAHYNGWRGMDHIGDPIPAMVTKVREWIAAGDKITIFTARVSDQAEAPDASHYITKWLLANDLPPFEITATKLKSFTLFVDDRAVGVIKNRGIFV